MKSQRQIDFERPLYSSPEYKLARDVPNNDKVSRIPSLDGEYANESLCDWMVSNNRTPDSAVEQIIRIMR